jgi:hypothetical protein
MSRGGGCGHSGCGVYRVDVSMSRLEGTIERAERRALARDALRELK